MWGLSMSATLWARGQAAGLAARVCGSRRSPSGSIVAAAVGKVCSCTSWPFTRWCAGQPGAAGGAAGQERGEDQDEGGWVGAAWAGRHSVGVRRQMLQLRQWVVCRSNCEKVGFRTGPPHAHIMASPSAHLVQGKNKPSRRQRKKQANIIEERKPAMKVGRACCWCCLLCWCCCCSWAMNWKPCLELDGCACCAIQPAVRSVPPKLWFSAYNTAPPCCRRGCGSRALQQSTGTSGSGRKWRCQMACHARCIASSKSDDRISSMYNNAL